MFLISLTSMETYIDLHTHSIYSDGLYTPQLLVRSLALNGINVFSKTDHDTLNGWEETKREAEKWGLTAIPGIEFSVEEYHLLGYGFDMNNSYLLETVNASRELQRRNCQRRVKSLEEHGIPINFEKVQKNFPESRLGKMNIILTMLRDRECRDYFRKIHGNASPKQLKSCYLDKGNCLGITYDSENLSSKIAIDAIHSAGGIAILAHPGRDVKALEELIVLRQQGIDGLEIQPNFYENYPVFESYAKKNNLLLTYGSDYHDACLNRGLLGRGMNILSKDLQERLF